MQRMLILDDDPITRKTLGVYGEMLGYEPLFAVDANVCGVVRAGEAVCSAERGCADIFLVSQKQQSGSGLDLVALQSEKGCRIDPQHKAIMAGNLTEQEFRQAGVLGCYVLQKPVTYEIFENWLNSFERSSGF